MMTTLVINCTIDAVSIIVSMLAYLLIFMFRKINQKVMKDFFPLLFFNTLTSASNLIGLIYKGDMSPFGLAVIPVANFCEFLFSVLTSAAFLHYLLATIRDAGQEVNRSKHLYIPYVIYILLLAVNVKHPMFYRIDEFNVYHRMDHYIYLMIFAESLILESLLVYLRYRKIIPKQKGTSSMVYFILPLVGLAIQTRYYGIAILQLFTTLTLLFMYILVMQYALDLYVGKQQEIQDMRTKIMLSQIRPHFIFNVLTNISALCHNKAPLAEKAVISFSRYLRGNIDYLSSSDLIPFTDEMQHVQHYLELEMLRFEERVMADFDLQDTNFKVPPLSIQPLVENAVKHGITKRPEGGFITISSVREGNEHVITIADDGVGFDPSKSPDDGRVHVGVSNSRERMETLLNASFDIHSVPNEGTTITIRIPVTAE